MGAHEYGDRSDGHQILDRPDVDGITQRPSPRYTDLDGLMDSCFNN